MSKRIAWVDIVRYVCIICVMATHFSFNNHELRVIYYPFFLVLFYFCSGYCYRRKAGFKEHFVSKVKQLLIPWLVFSYGNILLSGIMSFKEHEGFATELWKNALQIRGYGDKLWFLSSLFVAYLAFYFVEKRINNKNALWKYLGLLSVLYACRELYVFYYDGSAFFWGRPDLPWRLDYLPNMLLYMLFGYAFRHYFEDSFDKYNTLVLRVLLTVIYLALINYSFSTDAVFTNILNICFDYVKHLLGSAVVIAWCKKIKINRYLSFVGQNTLTYFCIHNKFVTLLELVVFAVLPGLETLLINNVLAGALGCIIGSLFISVLLIIPTKLFIRFCPKLIGRW